MQRELTAAGPLLDERGRLTLAGYSRRPLLTYERGTVKAGRLRIKEWDYYLICNDRHAVALTVADNGYIGLVGAALLEFGSLFAHTKLVTVPLSLGRFSLPNSSLTGDIVFEGKGCAVSFVHTRNGRRLTCRFDDFKNGKPFEAELLLDGEPPESMNIAIPFSRSKRSFYYNRKVNCIRAQGRAVFDGKTYEFSPDDSFATLDWGRGVWPYRNTWYWSSLNGLHKGVPFGFNLGGGFGNTSAATENALFYKGHIHKLGEAVFNIPKDREGRHDYLKSWIIGTDDGRLSTTFMPILDRADKINAVVVCSDQHQVFGRFSGTAKLDDGTEIKFKDLIGFAEKVHNRW